MPTRTEGRNASGGEGGKTPPPEPDDADLDHYVRIRLALAGVDLSVLPESDPDAPVDQVRILRSARAFLRSTVRTVSGHPLGEGEPMPHLYPTGLPGVAERPTSGSERDRDREGDAGSAAGGGGPGT